MCTGCTACAVLLLISLSSCEAVERWIYTITIKIDRHLSKKGLTVHSQYSRDMEFTNVKKISPNAHTFTLTPTHVTYANTLRRLIMTGVEMVGFRADMTSTGTTTDVSMRENTTPMTNEMLAHRIGLLPIAVKEPTKWNPEQYVFQLTATGNKDKPRDIYASEFVITEKVLTEVEPVKIPTERFFPPNPQTGETCLIATLYPGETQKLDLIAKATVGTGREHARFQPTCQCSYEYTRDSDLEKREALFVSWLADAKKVSAESIDKDSDRYKALEREFNTMEVARCYLQDERGEPYSFDFMVESTGILDVPYIITRACEVGEAMFAKYVNIDKGDAPEDVRITPTASRILGFDFMFRGHDHTLGNMLQTYLVENNIDIVDKSVERTQITYAGYKVPHPLRDEMLLRIGVKDGKEATARKALAEACQGCVDIFRQIRNAWGRATGSAAVTAGPKKSLTFRRKAPAASKEPAASKA